MISPPALAVSFTLAFALSSTPVVAQSGGQDAWWLAAWRAEVEQAEAETQSRLEQARMLTESGDLDAATDAYAFLWVHMISRSTSRYTLREPIVVVEMTRLTRRHPPARVRFAAFRDACEVAVRDGTARDGTLHDWLRLNAVLGDGKRSLDWIERHADEAELIQHSYIFDRAQFRMLARRERWAEAGAVLANPARFAHDVIAVAWAGVDEDLQFPEQMEDMACVIARDNISMLYAALLAAERDEEAAAVAAILLDRQDDYMARPALVAAALEAGEARAEHLRWLDEAADEGVDGSPLRSTLNQTLAGPR